MKRLMELAPSFLLAFLAGVFVASLDAPPEWFLIFLCIAAAVLLLATFFVNNKKLPFIIFICLGLFVGFERYAIWDHTQTDPLLEWSVGQMDRFEGIVADEPDVREGKTHLTVELVALNSPSKSEQVSGTALVIVNRFPEYHYGDRVVLNGKLTLPQKLTEDDGRVFDYPAFLRSKGIRYQMLFPSVTLLGMGEGNPITGTLFGVKARFESAIGDALPSPQSALLSGLLLGGKQSLGATWLERFRIAGIVHIIVLSGYNMTVVAEWLAVLFRSLGFYGSLGAGSVGIILFALMTGGGATVMRAAIMALIVLLSKATGRSYDMGRALLVAGALMVMQNPSILLFDPSFQLSFLASLGLIFISPILERHISLFRKLPMWREVLISTVATQVAVLPLLLYQTGMLSLISLPANLLVLPLIPLTMLCGFVAGAVALLSPTLGVFIGLPAYGLLSWILTVATYAEKIPFAALHIGSIPEYLMFGAYTLVAASVRYERQLSCVISRLLQARAAPPSN